MQPSHTFLWKNAFENHRYRILFVDDKLYALKSVSAILRKAGYVVYTAQTYEEAIKILDETHIHLGIFDLNLAGDAESPSDPEPRNYEGLDLATRADFPLLRIIYTGNKDTDIVVSALNNPQTIDYIIKGEDVEDSLLKKVENALTGSLRINQDLHLHWQNISLQQIVQTVYPDLSIEQQMEHMLELEDLFRIQFFSVGQDMMLQQVIITDLQADKAGHIWLKVSAYTGNGRWNNYLVLCGEGEALMREDELFDSISPQSYQIRSAPLKTVHYGIHAYEFFDGNLHHIHTLTHYLQKGQDDFVSYVMDILHTKRFQTRYQTNQSTETGTLYSLASGKEDTLAWEVTEELFEIVEKIVGEWQHMMPVGLTVSQSQISYGSGKDVQVYPHPIVHMETLCNYEVSRPVGMTHGNLRVNSIFANESNGEVLLFDYSNMRETSLLRDYVTLERSIHLEMISLTNIDDYQVLATALAGSDGNLATLSLEVQRAVHHIRQIRQLAIHHINCEMDDYLQDLYVDLVTYLLTYPQHIFAGYETVRKYTHCFLLAGQICNELQAIGAVTLSEQGNDDVWMDAEKYRVRIFGKSVDLTEKQFGLFEYLYTNLDQNCTYADIIEKGLHEELLHDNIKLEKPRIQTAVSRLRPEVKKFGFRIEAWHNGYRLIWKEGKD